MEKSDRLEKLEQEREALNKKIRLEQNRLAKKTRKDDTRRKIIAGALALTDMDKNPDSPLAIRMKELLETYVERDTDRTLFGLEPKTADTGKMKKGIRPSCAGLKTLFFGGFPPPYPRGYFYKDDIRDSFPLPASPAWAVPSCPYWQFPPGFA